MVSTIFWHHSYHHRVDDQSRVDSINIEWPFPFIQWVGVRRFDSSSQEHILWTFLSLFPPFPLLLPSCLPSIQWIISHSLNFSSHVSYLVYSSQSCWLQLSPTGTWPSLRKWIRENINIILENGWVFDRGNNRVNRTSEMATLGGKFELFRHKSVKWLNNHNQRHHLHFHPSSRRRHQSQPHRPSPHQYNQLPHQLSCRNLVRRSIIYWMIISNCTRRFWHANLELSRNL